MGQYPWTLAAPTVTWEMRLSLQTLPSGLCCCHLSERNFCLGATGARFIAVNILVLDEHQKHGATPLLPPPTSSFLEQTPPASFPSVTPAMHSELRSFPPGSIHPDGSICPDQSFCPSSYPRNLGHGARALLREAVPLLLARKDWALKETR